MRVALDKFYINFINFNFIYQENNILAGWQGLIINYSNIKQLVVLNLAKNYTLSSDNLKKKPVVFDQLCISCYTVLLKLGSSFLC